MRSSSSAREECILLASSASSEKPSSSASSASLIAFSIPHFTHIRRFQSAAATAKGPASIALAKASGEHLFQIHAEKNACDVYECPGEKGHRQRKKGNNNNTRVVKDRRVKRFVFNWTPTVVCCSNCGSYVAIGFRSGEVNIWERSSGKLRGSFTAHFKKVSKMTFTSDGSSLITCSEDTVVSAWSVVEALTH